MIVQLTLLDDAPEQVAHDTSHLSGLAARIVTMHRAYGRGPETARCQTCVHLYRKLYDKTYYKCDQFADTNGPGTDWRVGWPACGKYESTDQS